MPVAVDMFDSYSSDAMSTLNDQVNQVTLAYNGDIVIMARVGGHTKTLAISQSKMLEIIKSIETTA